MVTRRAQRAAKSGALKLSKTRYQWGLQCEKRLWLDACRRELATAPDAGLRARLKQGHRVGDLARERWPGAVLVREPASRHERAEETTRALLADPAVPAICEGAFSFEDLRVRADVVTRNGDAFDLVEVKSTTRVKADHISDAGVQLRVLEGAGVRVGRVGLLHLNREYVWTGGAYDLARLFTLEDISGGAREAAVRVDENVKALRAVLASSDEPGRPVGRHCTVPYECPFREYCWREVDYHHVCELPLVSDGELEVFAAAGVSDIAQLKPASIYLAPAQELARRCVTSGRPYADHEALAEALDAFEYPISSVAVAFARVALPLFEGLAPYESLPVAWSLHTLDADGMTLAKSFTVGSEVCDPRPEFFASLAVALPESGTIACYEPGDLEVLVAGAIVYALPLADSLRARGAALRHLVESHYYDAALAGSFSLNAARAALAGRPARHVGADISAIFGEWAAKECKPSRRTALKDQLRAGAEDQRDGLREVLEGLLLLAEGEAI